MEILAGFAVALMVLDILALLFGADSREAIERNPQQIGLIR